MSELFLTLLNRSIAAGWLIAALVLLRPLLKRASKSLCAALWGLVALRLIWPFSLESGLSLLPSAETIPMDIASAAQPTIHSGIPMFNSAVNPALAQSLSPQVGDSANPMQLVLLLGTLLWLAAAAGMAFYGIFSTLRLRRRLSTAVRCGENIYETDVAGAPFVVGLFRPTIYLPFHLSAQEREHMLAHERAHIRRGDHWWKALGYVFLTVFCFNPAVWLIALALAASLVLAVCLLTDPKTEQTEAPPAGKWFDLSEKKDIAPQQLAQWPGTSFYTTPEDGVPLELLAQQEDGTEKRLFFGMPIESAYFCDLNGDGCPEVITCLAFGSGMIDVYTAIYDYENRAYYEIRDRGSCDYLLCQEEDGTLWVEKYAYPVIPSDPDRKCLSRESIVAAYEAIIRQTPTLTVIGEITQVDDAYLHFVPDGQDERPQMYVPLDELPAGPLPEVGQRVEFTCNTNTVAFGALRCVSSIRLLDGAETGE